MKKRSILAILAAMVLCCILAFSASADYLIGDVDGNGTLTANDARKVLRASVKLETLTAEQFEAADTDFNGLITANDARKVLRASVKLETLHTHTSYKSAVTTEPTCQAEGVRTYTCDNNVGCKKSYTEPIAKVGHNFNKFSVTKESACKYNCGTVAPSFNTIVNSLKDYSNGNKTTFTSVLESIAHNDKMELSGALAGQLGDEENVATTETTYNPLKQNIQITDKRFPVTETSYVSNLTDGDVKSIKIEKVNKVDYLSTLPDSYNYGKIAYDLTGIKNTAFPDAYKITVVLPEEKIDDITKSISGASPYDKIYATNYRNNFVEPLRYEIVSSFAQLGAELGDIAKTETKGALKTNLTVEYYVDATTFAPLGAKYSHRFDINFNIKLADVLDPWFWRPWIVMSQNMYMIENSYYIFPSNLAK